MKSSVVIALVGALLVAGCAGREANIVPVVQQGDGQMSCGDLKQEIAIYSQSLSRLTGDSKGTLGKNVATGAVGVLIFPPALFLMNLKGAAREEAKSLQDRISGLTLRYNEKKCNPPIQIKTGQ